MALSKLAKILIGIFIAIILIIIIVCLVVLLPTNNERMLEIWPKTEEMKGNERFFHIDVQKNFTFWENKTEQFLQAYMENINKRRGSAPYNCDYRSKLPPGTICDFELDSLGKCTKGTHYGYPYKKPCLFLKLNNIEDSWEPEAFTLDKLPSNMPKDLQSYIARKMTSKEIEKAVWISCEGVYGADKDNIGLISYSPDKYIPGYYFNKEGYSDPLISIQFENPTGRVIISVECKAWAPNIKKDRSQPFISTEFILLIDL